MGSDAGVHELSQRALGGSKVMFKIVAREGVFCMHSLRTVPGSRWIQPTPRMCCRSPQ